MMEERLAHKLLLKHFCEQTILQRIAISQQAMDNAQAAANLEGKVQQVINTKHRGR